LIFAFKEKRNLKKQKLHIITLGCPKNTADSEVLANQIEKNNIIISNSPETADMVIINTCGFIQDAKQESLDKIFEMINLKKEGVIKKVFVMGCLFQRYKNEMSEEIPEVDRYFGIDDFRSIIDELGGKYYNQNIFEHRLENPQSHYAYLKISDGCDHPCSFCAIPGIKGSYRSKKIPLLLREAENLVEKGVKEINLVAQDSTYYGMDLYGEKRIGELLRKMLKIKGIEWLRLMYAYPAKFPFEILDIMLEFENFCKYIDLPIQHISDKILKSMRRGISKKATMDLLDKIRKKVPGITLRTSLIIGYPGETKKEFGELLKFVEDVKFNRLGVFTYSPEENTYAYSFPDRISPSEKEERKKIIMETQREISRKYNENMLNEKIKVFIDNFDKTNYIGRTEGDAPEIDNGVFINRKSLKDNANKILGHFIYGSVYKYDDYDLFIKPVL
jgi:ribosomal protein S12 methylthiotransferase